MTGSPDRWRNSLTLWASTGDDLPKRRKLCHILSPNCSQFSRKQWIPFKRGALQYLRNLEPISPWVNLNLGCLEERFDFRHAKTWRAILSKPQRPNKLTTCPNVKTLAKPKERPNQKPVCPSARKAFRLVVRVHHKALLARHRQDHRPCTKAFAQLGGHLGRALDDFPGTLW